nr:MAG TPA: ERF superfamily protein [Caudoviricetes sp.]
MDNKMTLHEKLNLIQTKLEAPKDMWAYNHKYKYRSAESILAALKPFLREFGITLTTETKIVIILHRIYIECTVMLSDGKETISANGMAREEETSNQGLNVAQITGSVTSYAKKYALGNLFAIDDVKDPDSNEPTQQVQAAQQSTTATVSQAQSKQTPKQAPKQVKQQAPQGEEERIMLLLQDISHARSRKTLATIWNENEDLQSNPRFKEATEEAAKKYPK